MGLDIHPPVIHTPTPTQNATPKPLLRHTPPSDERPSLPSIGLSISRPSSRLSTTSSRSLSGGYFDGTRHGMQLPGLNALANIAANTPPPERHVSNPLPHGQMGFYNVSPVATPGGMGSAPPVCQNCSTSTTPLWRRDENGSVLCNACGLFLKLHGKPRPISLKTDVIKSRNRVKAQAKGQGKRQGGVGGDAQGPQGKQISLAASHPGIAQLNPEQRSQLPQSAGTDASGESPISRTGTPGLGGHNIAPQHLFDQVVQMPGGDGASSSYGPSPSIPQFSFRAHSPGAASTSSLTAGGMLSAGPTSAGHMDGSHDFKAIQTRVSELEVINDLFRGRVAELEALVQAKQQQADAERLEKEAMRSQLEDAKRRIEELEGADGVDGHRAKRLRVEDFVQEDGSGSES